MIYTAFWRFYRAADTKYTIHSPFVYDFIENILEDDRLYYAYHEVETVRKLLLTYHDEIEVTDYGAGSKYTKASMRPIRQIAKTALSSPAFCRLLFRIVKYYKPQHILEMGTSLGISTAYLRMGALDSQLHTLEGCPNIAERADRVFQRLKLKDIQLRVGPFSETLKTSLETLQQVDLVFFDGNHRLQPTLDYYEQVLPFSNEHSIFIFDDIYWSEEMRRAWEQLKEKPEVTLSIDLFSMGLLFFRKDFKSKQHFKIAPWYWKPWRMGFLR
jgi:predicted O-methyltransferase YrrM